MRIFWETSGSSSEFEIPTEDASYRYRTIMGENELTIYWSLSEYMDLHPGSHCDYEGERYTLMIPQNFKKFGTKNFEYVAIMHSAQSLLRKYKYRDTISQRLKFSMTTTPLEHLKMLVANMNQRDSGWTVGTCLTATEKVLSFNHQNCLEALQIMAESFKTEWEIVGKAINLNKVEYNRATPLELAYGRGYGLKPGVGRTNVSENNPMEILFVEGGERNIDKNLYGSAQLLLPKSQQLIYEGRTYVTDPTGMFIKRNDKAPDTGTEASLDLSNIYPSRVGTVTSVIPVDIANNKYDFMDITIPASLDFTACLIPGNTMTVIFQTGMLTGKQFEVKYIHVERKFQITSAALDGIQMPNEQYKPRPIDTGYAADTYIVFGISLPPAYVCDNPSQTGASWDLFRESAKYMFENEDSRFNFTGDMDGIWSKANWATVGPKIRLGGMVLFSDKQFEIDGELVRIVGIKDFLNNPQEPTIELSNMPIVGSILSDMRKVQENEVVVFTIFKEAQDLINRRREEIINVTDNKLNAEELIRTRDITPRMLAPDAGTPQFSVRESIVAPRRNTNTVVVSSGTVVSHSFRAINKADIQM